MCNSYCISTVPSVVMLVKQYMLLILTPVKPIGVLTVTGAFAKPLFLGSDGKGQLKPAEDYHELWWS